MAVVKRQGREKLEKIEQRKEGGLECGPQVKQTTLLASPVYRGQAHGEENTYKKRSKRERGLSLSLSLWALFSSYLWVDMPSHLKDGFSYFLNKIEL